MVIVHGRDGSLHDLEGEKGKSLMRQLRPLKVGVLGTCNGNAICGTCHVYVAADWLGRLEEPDEYELEKLDEVENRRADSRLSCQIDYQPELDGIEVTVAPR